MPLEGIKLFNFNQYWKSDKRPSIIHADLETWIKKIDRCKNKPE